MHDMKICAAITAYFPDDHFPERVKAIAEQVDWVIVIDNGDGSTILRESLPSNSEVYVNNNKGSMAGALNVALRRARLLEFEYLITFDQDSTVPAGLITGLLESANLTGAAIVGPNFINSATKAPGRFYLYKNGHTFFKWFPSPAGIHEALFVITSGMLIHLKALPDVIEYREEFLVDLVDIDFCLATRALGLRVMVNTDVSMSHAIGNKVPGSWRFSTSNYNPNRKYLSTKNRIIVWHEHWRKYPAFVLSDILIGFADFARTLLLERKRQSLAKAFYEGGRDGLRFIQRG